ncbi:MAG: TonB-dependent receptor [Bacteroidales bacterium]|nr:TonB-dependent receptor [Bacteroidales bacterium]MDD2322960.1 TonB-dependent receptor [Bacteroidales bacterium]MDD3960871.1 TonB-dependent receptor [Bacteroidales bacterium]
MKHLFGVILFFISVAVFGQNGVIKGRVYNAATNEPLPFTNIIIYGTTVGSTSDLDGNYIFTGISPGFVRLQASSVGYKMFISEEVMVTSARDALVDIAMTEVATQLETVVITASPFKRLEESPVSMRTLGVSEIEKSPGANRDISKVIQTLPGVSGSVSFRNDIIVRGGGPSENVYFLDDVEIPYLNHFSTQGSSGGPVGIINADFIREVDFYSGAFPASRGNALSSVFNFRQVDGDPDNLNFKGSVGASDLALTLDGPIGNNTTFTASFRRSYLKFLFDILGLPFLPTYNDVQFKVKTKFDLKNELTVIGLGALDDFSLNLGLEDPDESQQYILGYIPVNLQKSYTVGAVYKHFGENGYDLFVVSRNYLNNRQFKYANNDDSLEENLILDYNSDEIETKFRYEYNGRSGFWKYNYGVGAEYAQYLNTTFQQLFLNNEATEFNYASELNLWGYNFFGQLSRKFFNERLTGSFGLRFDGNTYSASMQNLLNQTSPRFSLSYAVRPDFFVNLNTGRYFQQPSYTTMGYRDRNDVLVNKENDLTYIRVDHLVGGVEYNPTRDSKITLEGFYKWYDNYPFSVNDRISLASKGADFGTFGDEEVTSTSSGKAFGAEFFIRDKSFKNFNIILSYTYVRSLFTDEGNTYISSAWDNRHLLTAQVSRSLPGNWDVGMKYRFVGGPPYTPNDLELSSAILAWDARGRGYLDYDLFNSERLGAFNQLDLRVDKEWFFNQWSLNLYFDIQNILNQKSESPSILVRQLDENGVPVIDPEDPSRYLLKEVESETGTILLSLGIIVVF